MQKRKLFSFALLGTMLFVSCEKNLYDPTKIPEKEPTVADMVVPADFDWVMSQQVNCTVRTLHASQVSLYSDEACKEELIAQFTASPGNAPVVLSLPKDTKVIYLKYTDTQDKEKSISASVENKTVIFELPADSKALSQTRTDSGNSISLLYPSKWGTILFEDMFPKTGDFDFNDLVAKYQIMLSGQQASNGYVTNMRVSLYIYAVGGTLPYNPAFRLAGLNKDKIDMSSVKLLSVVNNPTPGVKLNILDSRSNELAFELENGTKNPNKIPGSVFLNTEPGFVTRRSETTQITVDFNFKEPVDPAQLQEPAVDFFLISKDKNTEIHTKGYQPVVKEYDYSMSGLHPNEPYCTDRNLVWAIKVPYEARHAIEKANFRAAYLRFSDWVQSGGKQSTDWYKTNLGHTNNALLIQWKR
ncbi:LruC domain-containing protein [Bacteroides sp.]|uniref:LruC domain-containing protein n=2 Tax=Bacteroides sp. TaxID=29523 RepID=UPI002FCA98D8